MEQQDEREKIRTLLYQINVLFLLRFAVGYEGPRGLHVPSLHRHPGRCHAVRDRRIRRPRRHDEVIYQTVNDRRRRQQ